MVNKNYDDEIYDEYIQKRESPTRKFTKALSTTQLVIIALIVLGIVFYTWFATPPYFQQNTGLLLLLGVAVVVFFMLSKETKGTITFEEARVIIKKEMEHMQEIEGILPQGRIIILEVGKLRRLEGKRDLWHCGVMIEGRKGPEVYRVDIDSSDGMIEGVVKVREGFTGKEVEQVKYILPRDMRWRGQYSNIYGKGRGGYPNNGQPPGPLFPQ